MNTGFAPDILSAKDAVHEDIFGAAYEPVASVGREEEIREVFKDSWLYQGQFYSCVSATSAAAVMWRIYEESEKQTKARLAWLYPFYHVPKVQGGTRVSDNLEFIRTSGICNDGFFPQSKYTGSRTLGSVLVDEKMRADATTRSGIQYKRYLDARPSAMMSELRQQPIMIGAYLRGDWWSEETKHGQPYASNGPGDTGHETLWVDNKQIDGKWYRVILDWDREDGVSIKYMDVSQPIAQATAICDLPGDWKVKRSEFRLVRNRIDQRIYFINSDSVHFHVPSKEAFVAFLGQRAWDESAWAEVDDLYMQGVKVVGLPPINI